MKLRVFSDLHLEFGRWTPPAVPADVVVLAGDIMPGCGGLAWGREHFPDTPIIYVFGNHEFYDGHLEALTEQARAEAARLGVHLLECDQVVINGVRILGCALWTDFLLDGRSRAAEARAKRAAKYAMNDFHLIRCEGGIFSPDDAQQLHDRARRWLEVKLTEQFDGETVVVTHHLPHRRSVHPKYEGHPLNPCFASHLPKLVRRPVALWIHGHTHESMDYRVRGTHVVCNPRGYHPMELNPAFEPTLVVEI
jgi:predicted phosphodiesterase